MRKKRHAPDGPHCNAQWRERDIGVFRARESLFRARNRGSARACNCLRGSIKGAQVPAAPQAFPSWRETRARGTRPRVRNVAARRRDGGCRAAPSQRAPVAPSRSSPRCADAIVRFADVGRS
eukprot:6747937-Lingulodinium_polyedra.AAC.1